MAAATYSSHSMRILLLCFCSPFEIILVCCRAEIWALNWWEWYTTFATSFIIHYDLCLYNPYYWIKDEFIRRNLKMMLETYLKKNTTLNCNYCVGKWKVHLNILSTFIEAFRKTFISNHTKEMIIKWQVFTLKSTLWLIIWNKNRPKLKFKRKEKLKN